MELPLNFEYYEILLYVLLYLWAFWALYVLVMGLYRANLDGRLVGLNKLLGFPFLIIGAVVDVLANITIASIVFMEPPKEWLVTTRLQRYMTYRRGYRKTLALYICDHILDPFDPRGNHC